MRVLILSDGVAGHDRSSLGILASLQKHRNAEGFVLAIRETNRFSRRLKRMLAGLIPFRVFWPRFYRLDGEPNPSNPLPVVDAIPEAGIDLVVSTGPSTAAANIAAARRLHARNIYFGFSKWPSDRFFTVLLTPARGRPHPHRAYALRPSELDAADLPDPRPLAPGGDIRRASLLFGGQSKHYHYTLRDMEILAERLIAMNRSTPWLRWTVFDSRRTPSTEFEHLARIVEASGVPVEFVRFGEAGLLSNTAAFSSDLVLVTADSMSMLAESIASRRPSCILSADRYRAPERDAVEHASAMAERRAFALTFSSLDAQSLLSGARGLKAMENSPLDALYETVARHGI